MLVPPLIALLARLIGAPIDELPLTPAGCLVVSPNLGALVTCLDTFTVPHDYYSQLTYALAQPLPAQRVAFSDAVRTILSVDGDCAAKQVPSALEGLYAFAPFREHCVLFETKSKCGTYVKGWGFAVVPARASSVERTLHVSAPHPAYDLGTVEQAAAVYEGSGARSLLVAGRKRTAFLASSGCVKGAPRRAYYMTDPAHNDVRHFSSHSVRTLTPVRSRNYFSMRALRCTRGRTPSQKAACPARARSCSCTVRVRRRVRVTRFSSRQASVRALLCPNPIQLTMRYSILTSSPPHSQLDLRAPIIHLPNPPSRAPRRRSL